MEWLIIIFGIFGVAAVLASLLTSSFFVFLLGVVSLVLVAYLNNRMKSTEEREKNSQDTYLMKRISESLSGAYDNFPYDSSEKINVKLLDKEMRKPCVLRVATVGDNLVIVPDRNNSAESYRSAGFTSAPYFNVPIEKVRYYMQEGETLTTTSGSGGGSGFSMITGWNGKTNPISIDTKIIDKKHTRLYFEDKGADRILTFNHDDFHIFKKLIPKKDYYYVQKVFIESTKLEPKDDTSFSDQLRKLKSLFEDGIISQHEFESKKREILNRM